MEDSISSFTKRTKADLLTFYTRNSDAKISDKDVEVICKLVALHSTSTEKLNIFLHTHGGNINSAIGLVEFLRSRYPEKINSLVMKVAKSSGAFIALCANQCYMHRGAVLSDFTLDQALSTPAYVDAQQKSVLLAYGGVCGRMDTKFWVSKFVLNSDPHGSSIPKEDLVEHGYVEKLVNFPSRVKPLAYLHNALVDEFDANSGINKIYGINEFIYRSP